jgi:hypothetical protein
LQKGARGDLQRTSKAHDRLQPRISSSAFEQGNLRAVKAAFEPQCLLGKPEAQPFLSEVGGEPFARRHARHARCARTKGRQTKTRATIYAFLVGSRYDPDKLRDRANAARRRREAELDELARLDEREVSHHYAAGHIESDDLEAEIERVVSRRDRADEQLEREIEANRQAEHGWEERARRADVRSDVLVAAVAALAALAVAVAIVVIPVGPDVSKGQMTSAVRQQALRDPPPSHGGTTVKCSHTFLSTRSWTCHVKADISALPDAKLTYAIDLSDDRCWGGTQTDVSARAALFPSNIEGCIK